MERVKSDMSLYFKFGDGEISGVTGNYVDDNINRGNVLIQKASELTLTTFESMPCVADCFTFFGTQSSTTEEGILQLQQ